MWDMESDNEPLERLTFDAATLMREHPPKFRHRNKTAVYDIACPAGFRTAGTITYSRWWAMRLPRVIDLSKRATVDVRPDVYDYAPVDDAEASVEWYVNFADPQLFFGYGTRLFAQDEIQVAEHPALACLREVLVAGGQKAVTVEANIPTPVVIRGVERRVKVNTAPDSGQGRPDGLYGNRFGDADVETIQRATSAIDPPTTTNLIAMAAPHGGVGPYRWDDINAVLTTAYTGFRAAVIESTSAGGPAAKAVVHTGFWGCGAFGGNRTMMVMLQLMAAHLAGVHRFVFHAVDTVGADQAEDAVALLDRNAMQRGLLRTVLNVTSIDDERMALGIILRKIELLSLQWGESDGN
jgi:hypothetical protein